MTKIIIDIPDNEVPKRREIVEIGLQFMDGEVCECTYPFQVLPKGHGRLIDADETLKAMNTWDKFGFEHTGCFVRNPEDDFIKYVHYEDMVKAVSGVPTIIEADKETENETN